MATLRPGNRPVLLIVDAQVGVLARAWEAPRVIGRIAHAVERARGQGVPVVWIQHEGDDLPRDSAEWQLAPPLQPQPGEACIGKRYESSFEETELEPTLARLDATHLVVAGAASNWCIRATSYGALDRGYDLTLLRDAHTTPDLDLGDGKRVEAAGIVAELNAVMSWIQYPGRRAATATADGVDFLAVPGARL